MKKKITKAYLEALSHVEEVKENLMLQKAAVAAGEVSGEMYIDMLIKIIIVIVIGGLLLGLLYVLFKDTLFPQLTQKITDLLNFTA